MLQEGADKACIGMPLEVCISYNYNAFIESSYIDCLVSFSRRTAENKTIQNLRGHQKECIGASRKP